MSDVFDEVCGITIFIIALPILIVYRLLKVVYDVPKFIKNRLKSK